MQSTYIPYKFEEGLVVSNSTKIRDFTVGSGATLDLSGASNALVSGRRIAEVNPFSTAQTIAPGSLTLSNVAISCASNLTWTGDISVAGDATFANPLSALTVSTSTLVPSSSATFAVSSWPNLSAFSGITVSGTTNAGSVIGDLTAVGVAVSGSATCSNASAASVTVSNDATFAGNLSATEIEPGVMRSEFATFSSSSTLTESQMQKRLWVLTNSPTLTLPNTDPFVAKAGISTFKTMIKGAGSLVGSSKFVLPLAINLDAEGVTVKWYRLNAESWYGYAMKSVSVGADYSNGSNYNMDSVSVSGTSAVSLGTNANVNTTISGTLTTSNISVIRTDETCATDVVSLAECTIAPGVGIANKLSISKQSLVSVSTGSKTLTVDDISLRVVRLASSSTITLPERPAPSKLVEVEFIADNNSISTSFLSSGTCIWGAPVSTIKGSFTLIFNDDGTVCKVYPIGSINDLVNRKLSNLTLSGTLTTPVATLTSPAITTLTVSNITDETTAVVVFNRKKAISPNIIVNSITSSNSNPPTSNPFMGFKTSRIETLDSPIIFCNRLTDVDISGLTTVPAIYMLSHTVIFANNSSGQSITLPSASDLDAVFTCQGLSTPVNWTVNILKLGLTKLTLNHHSSIPASPITFGTQKCLCKLFYTRSGPGVFSMTPSVSDFYYPTMDGALLYNVYMYANSLTVTGQTTITGPTLGEATTSDNLTVSNIPYGNIVCNTAMVSGHPIRSSYPINWAYAIFSNNSNGIFETEIFKSVSNSVVNSLTSLRCVFGNAPLSQPAVNSFKINPVEASSAGWSFGYSETGNSRLITVEHSCPYDVNFKIVVDSHYIYQTTFYFKISEIGSNVVSTGSSQTFVLPAAGPQGISKTFIKIYKLSETNRTFVGLGNAFFCLTYKIIGSVVL